ncbi:WH1 domain containing protein [Trichuris trichiura]|uniref:WH1 domain containing protein n=1 Tax=Trichuris trichiura TaxID=36087 RepID=A0A077Z9D9_TRITR|nr:WH1 domain containing protein [Trichuris trichiura]
MVTVRASVLLYDDNGKQWVPSGSSKQQEVSRVQLFQHVQQNTFRVVGRKLQDQEVVVNCAIGRGFRYNVTSETFHQWKDQQIVYGLNFISLDDAVTFGTAIAKAIEVVNTTSCGLPVQNVRPSVVTRPCPAPNRPLVNGNDYYEDRNSAYGQNRRIPPETSVGGNVYATAGYATVSAQNLHSPQKQTVVAIPPAPADPPLSSAYPTVKRQMTVVRKPPIVSNAPPPPPMPAAGAWKATSSTVAKQTNLAEALATAKLRKVSSAVCTSETKNSRSASVGSIESTVTVSRSGSGVPGFGHSDVISEITATLARRKMLQEGGGAGCATESSETDGSKADDIRKISDCRISRAGDAVSTHRKMPSGSSLSSQEEGAAQGWQKGLSNGLSASGSLSVDFVDQLKTEVVQCIKEEINRAKLELIDCLRKELSLQIKANGQIR